MHHKSSNLIVAFLLLSILGWGFSAFAQTNLQYQCRENVRYCEGVKPRTVGGYNIELISVLVKYKEKVEQIPDLYKIKFYLRPPSDVSKVYLTVRELNARYYYWLDRVKTVVPWRHGFDNVFEWSTDPVIKQLTGMTMYDLGVIVRLGNENPTSVERVAPAILYHSDVPQDVTGYLFTFKVNDDARISCSIYKDGQERPVFERIYPRKLGGRPFAVLWDASGAEAGNYKVLITGYFLNTNSRFNQSVELYHKPDTE